jgi:Ser/Thr protein kinase RdoA (MazF antagonist)
LARFHVAAASFPLPDPSGISSPGILERLDRVGFLLAGGLRTLAAHVERHARTRAAAIPAEIVERARHWLALFPLAVPRVLPVLEQAAAERVVLQPCIRDIWHDHVLFVGDQVTALVDFGALRAEHVSADIARLLGSLVGDDADAWQLGLTAYHQVRRLSTAEEQLVQAFDQSSVLLATGSWVEWIFQEGRQFENTAGVIARLDQNLARLRHLAGTDFTHRSPAN